MFIYDRKCTIKTTYYNDNKIQIIIIELYRHSLGLLCSYTDRETITHLYVRIKSSFVLFCSASVTPLVHSAMAASHTFTCKYRPTMNNE